MIREVNIASYQPPPVEIKQDFQAISATEDPEFRIAWEGIDRVFINQYVLTADIYGIDRWEKMFRILADPATESLEFRRQRILNRMQMRVPFTFRWLKMRLDDLIGAGKYKVWLATGQYNYRLGSWKLGRHPFRDPEYTLYIETALSNLNWWQELRIFVDKIKPANIVYALSPLVAQGLAMSSGIGVLPCTWRYRLSQWALGRYPFFSDAADTPTEWNYQLGTAWVLGENPFAQAPEWEMIKMPEQQSMTPLFHNLHAQYTAAEVAAVRFNESYAVTDIDKRVEGDIATLRYVLTPASGISEINKIELLRDNGDVLESALVFVPVPAADQLTFQHTISHKEGVIANG